MIFKFNGKEFRVVTIASAFVLTGFIGLILFGILSYAGWAGFIKAVVSREMLFAVKLSLSTATIATFLCTVVALPVAYAMARYSFKGKSIIHTVINIPMALPSLVVGFGLLLFFGTSWIGNGIRTLGIHVVFTPLGIILAQFTVNIAAMIRIMRSTFSGINPRYEYVARTLGCTRFQAARKVLLPMARHGLLAAVAITWSKSIGEFGAVIMIAGATRMKTETLPIALYLNMTTGDLESAAAAASILILISILSLIVFETYFNGKTVY